MAPIEQNLEGFWGPPTSTVDWCEANYEVSFYVAEFWNTVTNVFLFVPQLIAAAYCIWDGIETRYFYCYIALAVVGFGSFAFHGTLFYTMQLLDELPIIWGTAMLLYVLLENVSPPKQRNVPLAIGLLMFCVIDTIIYILWKNFTFFLASHGVLIFSLIYHGRKMMSRVKHTKAYYVKAILIYALALVIWQIDQTYCGGVGKMRLAVGPYLAPLLQLHGWWHLLAGLGTFYGVLFCLEMRHNYLRRDYEIQKILGLWPYPRSSLDMDICNNNNNNKLA